MTNQGETRPAWTGALSQPQQLLAALLSAPTVGVGICDRQLRFRAVNDALAAMNGAPAKSHIGKPLHQILGSVAGKVGSALQHVFETGEPLSNFELSGQLPTRTAIGHWLEHYYPIKSRSGKVLQVSCIAVEVTSIDLLGNHVPGTRAVPELLSPQSRFAPTLQRQQPPFQSESPLRLPSRKSDLRTQPLTDRERQIVCLLANGKTSKEIAGILGISAGTVGTHRANVMLKLGIHSFADLVRYAVRNSIV
ncbi:MAG TPA: helix-turn-helix transcriptional regulator [Candidatus Dormibacteraeota bacterium]|nr:helix-turn-helix transcriptional regulator [Candidatus Dormibacteraeota bacterium]